MSTPKRVETVEKVTGSRVGALRTGASALYVPAVYTVTVPSTVSTSELVELLKPALDYADSLREAAMRCQSNQAAQVLIRISKTASDLADTLASMEGGSTPPSDYGSLGHDELMTYKSYQARILSGLLSRMRYVKDRTDEALKAVMDVEQAENDEDYRWLRTAAEMMGLIRTVARRMAEITAYEHRIMGGGLDAFDVHYAEVISDKDD